MTPEQLQAAYSHEYGRHEPVSLAQERAAHRAALVEVARQQAERDIEIAKSLVPIVVPLTARSETKRRIAHAIRAQFANPSTTPKETR